MSEHSGREPIYLFGKLNISETVTIQLVRFPGNIPVAVLDDSCPESAIPGYYYWDTSLIDSELPKWPERVTLLYVMTDGLGQEYHGSFVLNGYPEEVARTHAHVQALL